MNLDLTEVQSMLTRTAREFLEQQCPSQVVRDARESETGHSEALWRQMADLGWAGLLIDERYGGEGLGVFDFLLLAEELGRALAPVPLVSTALLCAPTIQQAGTEEQRERYLPAIARGDMIVAFALTEPSARYDAAALETRAVRDGDEFVLDGLKLFVRDGYIADHLLVAARTSDAEQGVTLFAVDAATPGITRRPLATMGADRQAEVRFEGVRVPASCAVGDVDGGWPLVEDILARGILAECAELVGVGQVALERTVAYAADRVQFGRPIGSFQAIQARCADMAVDVDGMRYSTYLAASEYVQGRPAGRAMAQAKAWVSAAIMRVVRSAHQIHAGIAFITDHDLYLYYNRAKAGELYYGMAELHREAVAASLLDQ